MLNQRKKWGERNKSCFDQIKTRAIWPSGVRERREGDKHTDLPAQSSRKSRKTGVCIFRSVMGDRDEPGQVLGRSRTGGTGTAELDIKTCPLLGTRGPYSPAQDAVIVSTIQQLIMTHIFKPGRIFISINTFNSHKSYKPLH